MEKKATFHCAACGNLAAEITFQAESPCQPPSLTVSGFMGVTTIFGDKGSLEEFFDRISQGRLMGRSASEAEFLGFHCRTCDQSYCEACWTGVVAEFDEGFYDFTKATCPKGHEQIIDD